MNDEKNKESYRLRFQSLDQLKKTDFLLDSAKKEGEERFVQIESDKFNLPYIDLRGVAPEPNALNNIKEEDAKEAKIAAFKQLGTRVYVAFYDPNNEKLKEVLNNLERTGLILVKFMASHASLEHVWSRYSDIVKSTVETPGILDINSEILNSIMSNIVTINDLKNSVIAIANGSKNFRISRIIEILVAGALYFKVSDMHIEPEKDKVRVRYRLDGSLEDICFLDLKTMKLINSRLKLLSGTKLSTTLNAQDGRFSILDSNIEIEVRVSIIPNNYGESFVMRFLDPRNIMANIESLGMSTQLFEIVSNAINKPNGIVLTTGPTGSGKTTTLYAFISKLYSPTTKIITIEDPVEYHLNGIVQTQVEEEKGYTFLSGLRAAMRQDPDIIMVGEIRDEDTAKVAINAALTGHLVFSTLHTNNAAGSIPRLLELGANQGTLASALSLCLAQRLVRKLCPNCKKETLANEKETKIITNILGLMKVHGKQSSMDTYNVSNEYKIYIANEYGCEKCNHGYKGRMGVFEAIKMDRAISDAIIEEKVINERKIKDLAEAQQIPTMREDGIIKILKGETSFEELMSAVDVYEE